MIGLWTVERQLSSGIWIVVQGSGGRKSYAQGWYDALTSFHPRPAYRLIDDTNKVRETCNAASMPTTNVTQEKDT